MPKHGRVGSWHVDDYFADTVMINGNVGTGLVIQAMYNTRQMRMTAAN